VRRARRSGLSSWWLPLGSSERWRERLGYPYFRQNMGSSYLEFPNHIIGSN
jgi:hypothetical protein